MSSRRIDILILACFVCGVTIGVVTHVFKRRDHKLSRDQLCGPSFNHFSVEITNHSVPQDGGYIWTERGIFFPLGTYWKSTSGHLFGCPCLVKTCVSICLLSGKELKQSEQCIKKSNSLAQSKRQDLYHLYLDRSYETENKLELVTISKEEKPTLLDDGRVFVKRVVKPYLNQKEYCLDFSNGDRLTCTPQIFEYISDSLDDSIVKRCAAELNLSSNFSDCERGLTEDDMYMCKDKLTSSTEFKECYKNKKPYWIEKLKKYAMIFSVPFLLLSILVALLTPSLHTLHRKALLCYMLCLIVSYTLFPLIQIFNPGYSSCIVLGTVLNLGLLGSFFWLNVKSLEIWLTFSDLPSSYNSRSSGAKQIECQKFLLYSVYAWGGTITIASIALFMDLSPMVPKHYVKPQFTPSSQCWNSNNDARVLYFYLPTGVLLGLNCIMFITTAVRVWRHTVNSKGLSSKSGKQRFSLYGKLFMVMGVNWLLEVMSFVIEGNDIFWIASDLTNSLIGVIIFLLFFCKKITIQQLRERFSPQSSRNRFNLTSCNTRTSYLNSRTNSINPRPRPNGNMQATSF